MTHSGAKSVLLRPSIPTGGRQILATSWQFGPLMFGLSLVPAIGFAIALVDPRVGFKLLMASLAVVMLVLILMLVVRVRALQPGAVRASSSPQMGSVEFGETRSSISAGPTSSALSPLVRTARGWA